MNEQFIRTDNTNGAGRKLPFFEDARADLAPYYSSTLKHGAVVKKITTALAVLGGVLIEIQGGYYPYEKHYKRHGGVLVYQYGGRIGKIKYAGLPIRKPTENKIERSKVQALLNVHGWLVTAHTQQTFTPGAFANPLILTLLVDGEKTVVDFISQSGNLPQLAAGGADDIIEGEFVIS